MRNLVQSVLGYFIILSFSGCGQPVEKAHLDTSADVIVGKTFQIKSQFNGLPLVEPSISAHPSNNNHLLVAAMVVTDINRPYESCRLSSFVSLDGGIKWTETQHNWWGYDPWTSILPNGKTVMSWIGNKGGFNDTYPIRFFNSNDGGVTWLDEIQTIDGNHDGTKVTGLNNEFYFTTVRFKDNMGTDVTVFRKVDGDDFSSVGKIDGQSERLNFCEPAILNSNKVIIPYFQENKVWVRTYDSRTGKMGSPSAITASTKGFRGYSRMVADANQNSSFQSRIYFVRANASGVIMNYSKDEGTTWSKDRRIDLYKEPKVSNAMVPSLAVNKDGWFGISWVDSYDGITEKKNDVYFAVSKDGGESFQQPVRVTEISTNPFTTGNGDVANKFTGGGHYLGIAARPDGSFQLVWSDSRSGTFELQTSNVIVKE